MNNLEIITLPDTNIKVAVKKFITIKDRQVLQETAMAKMTFKNGEAELNDPKLMLEIQNDTYKKAIEIYVKKVDGLDEKEFKEKNNKNFFEFFTEEISEADGNLIFGKIAPKGKDGGLA
jgi:uncharacterized cupredoxin-like copper-binding protein